MSRSIFFLRWRRWSVADLKFGEVRGAASAVDRQRQRVHRLRGAILEIRKAEFSDGASYVLVLNRSIRLGPNVTYTSWPFTKSSSESSSLEVAVPFNDAPPLDDLALLDVVAPFDDAPPFDDIGPLDDPTSLRR